MELVRHEGTGRIHLLVHMVPSFLGMEPDQEAAWDETACGRPVRDSFSPTFLPGWEYITAPERPGYKVCKRALEAAEARKENAAKA